MREVHIKNQEETRDFGIELAGSLEPGSVVALIGDLGTGKTTLTKYIAEGMGVRDTVTSPTFTIIREYDGERMSLFHFDVYRIDDPADMYEIGYEEYFFGSGVSVVEWADRIEELLPVYTKRIYIDYGKDEEERIYKCTF